MIAPMCLLCGILALTSARTIKYRYPAGQARELARAGHRPDHYTARIPGYQHALEMASPRTTTHQLKPTTPPHGGIYEVEESWDSTETVWVTSVDPQLVRTITVTTKATLAKLIDFSENEYRSE